jgi:hypothetical protein
MGIETPGSMVYGGMRDLFSRMSPEDSAKLDCMVYKLEDQFERSMGAVLVAMPQAKCSGATAG